MESAFQVNIRNMGTTPALMPNGLRSDISWTKAIVWAALTTLVVFAAVNRHGCWLYRNQLRDLVVFFYPFAWLVLFLAVRTRGRIVLLLVATLSIVFLLGTGFWGIIEVNSGAEAAAFQALHQMQSSLATYRAEHQLQQYPGTMPSVNLTPSTLKYYRFEYLPMRSASGEIVGYIIQATPARRDCNFHRSFTITDDGRVFWTLEPRAATLSDTLYNW
jgi:hypothetical protein